MMIELSPLTDKGSLKEPLDESQHNCTWEFSASRESWQIRNSLRGDFIDSLSGVGATAQRWSSD
jgi:hypothetical protein